MAFGNPAGNRADRERRDRSQQAQANQQPTTNSDGSVTFNYQGMSPDQIRDYKFNEGTADYINPETRQMQFSGDPAERAGQQAGLNWAELGYGENIFQTGQNIGDIRNLMKSRMAQGGQDPVSAAIMNQKAGTVANAQRNLSAQGVKGGAGQTNVSATERAANQDIAASLYGQQRQSMKDLQGLESNTLAGTMSLMQGERAAQNQPPEAPKAQSWTDSVICTELYVQGIMSHELYELDCAYGRELLKTSPEVIIGYHVWSKPLVKLMKKSKLFTKIVSYPAMKWAKQIAKEENSIFGNFAVFVGQPVCAVIGKLKILGDKYVQFNH